MTEAIVNAKTVTCGWCKAPGIGLEGDGSLAPHTVPKRREVCRGFATYREGDPEDLVPLWRIT